MERYEIGEEDLDTLLGVTVAPEGKRVGCGKRAPKVQVKRFTEWNNLASFTFVGYVALVRRVTCEMCGAVTPICEGVFKEEKHEPSGTRRLQQVNRGTPPPPGNGHKQEVKEEKVQECGYCITALGFTKMVDGKGQPWMLVVGEEL